jgi:resuscitation-promoting factor RpfA
VSRHADGGRSFVVPIVAVAALAAIAALTVSVLALRHNSSSSGGATPLAQVQTVYSTVTVGADADPGAASSNSSAPASATGGSGAVAQPSGPTATKATPTVPALSSGIGAISVYVVQPGDNLTRIAERLHEDVNALYSANSKTIGVNSDLIFPGERLILALPS